MGNKYLQPEGPQLSFYAVFVVVSTKPNSKWRDSFLRTLLKSRPCRYRSSGTLVPFHSQQTHLYATSGPSSRCRIVWSRLVKNRFGSNRNRFPFAGRTMGLLPRAGTIAVGPNRLSFRKNSFCHTVMLASEFQQRKGAPLLWPELSLFLPRHPVLDALQLKCSAEHQADCGQARCEGHEGHGEFLQNDLNRTAL